MPIYIKKKAKTFSSQKKAVNLQPLCVKVKKELSKYEIAIQGLGEKRYTFEFEGGDKFFASFEQDIIEKGNFTAIVTLDKSATMLRLQFDIQADVVLECDRCLDEFTEHLRISEPYLYKFGHTHEVVDDAIEIIPFGEAEINVSQHIFDFIALAIPMKKLHPRFRDAENAEEQTEASSDEQNDMTDPRWAALKNILNK